ncbi:DUF6241 domain-containing protein [Ectobacillus panaciterrae]|uniref:DUF6241 domain-containing protein n=1 Tax=Ectobacillus panaciterrae TaxID=363872 RepID=UPI0003FEFD84|nr:DUF6241 domain-containing protein [Ectobacillus panaciterrae]
MFRATKKFAIWTSLSIGVLAAGGYGVNSYISNWEKGQGIKQVKEVAADQTEEKKMEVKSAPTPTPQPELQPQPVQAPAPEPQPQKATDADIQSRMHEMTHQKVIADQRWGYIPMTPENIDTTIKLVEYSKDSLEHYDFYMVALNKWKAGDFSNCVTVHNQLWKWQGGELGKATRLATAQEEQAYINQQTNR